MSKSVNTNRKTIFGKRKGGKATKSLNKHNAKSAYHRRNASRQ
jgi:hypothetical protein